MLATHSAWSAVVVNYNAGRHLRACIDSLTCQRDTNLVEIIVVDNGSTDDSLASLDGTPVRVVHSPGNVGYARAANLGIAVSSSAYVAVLNPDVVLDASAGGLLCAALDENSAVGIVGPRISTTSGQDYPSAREIPGFATSLGHLVFGVVRPSNRWSRHYRQEHLDPATARASDWVSGAAVVMRREALDEVGGWDEQYFMFLEDVDLCVRLREHGWEAWYEPAAKVCHVEGVSRRSHPYRTIADHHRSAFRFARTHWVGPRRAALPIVGVALAGRAVVLMGLGAVRAGLQHLPG